MKSSTYVRELSGYNSGSPLARRAMYEIIVEQPVPLDAPHHGVVGLHVRQFAVDEQVAHLEEGRVLGELVDGVAAVAQDARVAVDVGDGGLARRGVHESRVECHEPGVLEEGGDDEAVIPCLLYTSDA